MASSSPPASLVRRAVVAACLSLAVAPALTILGSVSVDAGPRPRSSSEDVAALATEALVALGTWRSTGDPLRYVEYIATRDATADLAAVELGLDPVRLAEAWATTHPIKQVALLSAVTQLGVPYRSRMSKEGVGFDCSGLTSYAWDRAGVSLTRSSGDQIRAATQVEREVADAGDLVHYPGHVMMYLGIDHAVVHSPNSGNLVEITFVTDNRKDTVVYGDPLRPAD